MVIETGWPNDYQNYMILSQGSGSFTRAFHAHASPAPPARRRHAFRLVGPVCGVARRDASGVACAFVCRRRERADAEDIRFHEGCLHSHRLLSDSCFCCFVCSCFLWACLVPITPPPPRAPLWRIFLLLGWLSLHLGEHPDIRSSSSPLSHTISRVYGLHTAAVWCLVLPLSPHIQTFLKRLDLSACIISLRVEWRTCADTNETL